MAARRAVLIAKQRIFAKKIVRSRIGNALLPVVGSIGAGRCEKGTT